MAKKMKKLLSLVLSLSLVMSLMSVMASAEGVDVAKIGDTPYATLAAAVEAANAAEGAVKIELIADTTFDAAMTITGGDVTISGSHTLSRADSYTGTLFTVANGAKLTLDGVIIDGGNDWTFDAARFKADVLAGKSVTANNTDYHTLEEGAPVAGMSVFVVNGSLVLSGGTAIQNHALTNSDSVCAFYVANGGYLETNNALITHNYKIGRMVVANVAAGGKWIVNAGTVMSENYCQGGNGGLCRTEGTVIINGGLFTNNYSIGNGSIFMNYKAASYLELNDGLFTENYCLNNGGDNWNGVIHCHYEGGTTFVMNGGTITKNYGSYCGGLSASKNGTPASITVNGGKIIDNVSALTGKDASLGQDITIAGDSTFGEVKAYRDVTVTDGKTMTVLETLYFWKNGAAMEYTGEGTVAGDVYLYNGADVTMNSGSWVKGLVTVNAEGKDSTLIVKSGATIDGIQVRVRDSVESGDYLNAEEAAAAQAASYVEEEGANVKSPVLFYHRLTPAQQSSIVVTYDYNGGKDAQGWSGCQLTSAEAFTPVSPAPMKDGYVFVGWKYAVENAPETLDMSGTEWYEGETIGASVRLVAQWGYSVTYTDGVAGEEVFADQVFSGIAVGTETPAFEGTPSRAGYTFKGWSPEVAETVTADATYVAQWEVIRIPQRPVVIPPVVTPPAGDDPTDTPVEEIPDEEVPTVDVPVEEEPAEEEEEIPDEDVPLADVPETGDMTALWAAMSAVSAAGVFFLGKKNKDEE